MSCLKNQATHLINLFKNSIKKIYYSTINLDEEIALLVRILIK